MIQFLLESSERRHFQNFPLYAEVAEEVRTFRRMQRNRFCVLCVLLTVTLIGCVILPLSIYKVWVDYHCRNKDHVFVPLPCTPRDVVRLDKVRPCTTSDIWCSAPMVTADTRKYNCSILLSFKDSSTTENMTCYKAWVSYRAWYEDDNDTTVGYPIAYSILRPVAFSQVTREFVYQCWDEAETETPFLYTAPIQRSISRRDYPLNAHE